MGGGDKGLRLIAGRPMIERVVERLKPQVRTLVLNANGDPSRFAALGLPVVADPIEGFAGPLAGVLAGLSWARLNAPGTVFVVSAATDTPFFPRDLVARFLDAADGNERRIALARSADGLHPVFGLWPIALAGDLEAALKSGTRKVLDWTGRHATVEVEFQGAEVPGVDPFFNVNTPEEIELANKLCSGNSP
ncbi:MAG: molybdenum cofactor guanylyltransferase MobA [Hyphomicrobiaceae bacterium]|nr:MAG: molybdenum cofactor guanylyltransferase MobA [Hyphomicrobiaceae bacterium]